MRATAMLLLSTSALATVAARGGSPKGPYLVNPCLNSTFKSAKVIPHTEPPLGTWPPRARRASQPRAAVPAPSTDRPTLPTAPPDKAPPAEN